VAAVFEECDEIISNEMYAGIVATEGSDLCLLQGNWRDVMYVALH
jgi:hypothetical protein